MTNWPLLALVAVGVLVVFVIFMALRELMITLEDLTKERDDE